MKSPIKMTIALVLGLTVVTTGCQQKGSSRDRTRIGRTARGPTGPSINGVPSALQPNSMNTQWGEVTSTNQAAFQDELYYFTAPMLAGGSEEDLLGSVSAQSGQQTGVVFWGEAPMRGAGIGGNTGTNQSGTLDQTRARLHIEIYDNKTGMTRADNSIRPQIIVHIGYDQEGFVGAQGSVQGNLINLVFKDGMGSVIMRGSLNSQYFTGQMYYTTTETGTQERQLGNFQVPACGFFKCN